MPRVFTTEPDPDKPALLPSWAKSLMAIAATLIAAGLYIGAVKGDVKLDAQRIDQHDERIKALEKRSEKDDERWAKIQSDVNVILERTKSLDKH